MRLHYGIQNYYLEVWLGGTMSQGHVMDYSRSNNSKPVAVWPINVHPWMRQMTKNGLCVIRDIFQYLSYLSPNLHIMTKQVVLQDGGNIVLDHA